MGGREEIYAFYEYKHENNNDDNNNNSVFGNFISYFVFLTRGIFHWLTFSSEMWYGL